MTGSHTLAETESQVAARLQGQPIDFGAMAVVSNLFRAANAVRNHLERTVLAQHNLSWTAFVVLWVAWVWKESETRMIAEESGISKATLTGVLKTLEKLGFTTRRRSDKDGRLVIVGLTAEGEALMQRLIPEFNKHETELAAVIAQGRRDEMADHLRAVTTYALGSEQ
jgi:DNA-binding MarR family transcriptional regulator